MKKYENLTIWGLICERNRLMEEKEKPYIGYVNAEKIQKEIDILTKMIEENR